MKKKLLFVFSFISFWASAQNKAMDCVYKCDFNPGDPHWNEHKDEGYTSYKSGSVFVMEHNGRDETYRQTNFFPVNPLEDYTIEVAIAQISGEEDRGYGLCYNYKGIENACYFVVSSNGYFSVFHYEKDKKYKDKDWTVSSSIKKGFKQFNKLAISKVSNQLRYYVNGNEVFSSALPKFYDAYYGFYVDGVMKVEVDYVYAFQKKKAINLIENYNSFGKKIRLDQNINSPGKEIAPYITADEKTLYVTRVKCSENIGDPEKDDIWVSNLKKDSTWSKLKNIGPPLNNKFNNFVIASSQDNNTLLLGNLYKEHGTKSEKGISISHRTKSGWSFPKSLNIKNYYNDNDYNEACLSPDGKVMLLTVERADTYGEKDVYFSFLQADSSWSEPKNIGGVVNSYGTETGPFLASDGKSLYFSSNGHPGYGSSDIFMSKRLDDTWIHWSVPKNLGPKINSEKWEAYYSIPASGKNAYVVSNFGDEENMDIFKIEQPESAKPAPVILIHGNVYNSETKKPMEAVISYGELGSNKILGNAKSHPETGAFMIALPKGKKYFFQAHHEGFLAVNANADASSIKSYKEENIDLYLTPFKEGQNVVMHNLFFVSNEYKLLPESFPELDRLYKLMVDNPNMKVEISGHTSVNSSGDKFNMDLSNNRAKAVKNYIVKKGIDEKRITSKGYGCTKPIYHEKDEKLQAKNRRVEFAILSK